LELKIETISLVLWHSGCAYDQLGYLYDVRNGYCCVNYKRKRSQWLY
jgi:hypothetical protein